MTKGQRPKLTPTIGFATRLQKAVSWLSYQLDGEKITQAKLGDLVAAEMRRPRPFDQTTVWNWFNGGMPDYQTVAAIARACGVRAGWLTFGEEPMLAPGTANAEGAEIQERPRPRPASGSVEAVRDAKRGPRRPDRAG